MELPFSLNIAHYRSLQSNCRFPFNHRSTFVIGPNNSGKSNVLRSIAAVFNKKYDTGDGKAQFDFIIKNNRLLQFAGDYRHLSQALRDFSDDLTISVIGAGGLNIKEVPPQIFEYAAHGAFLHDFSSSSDVNTNVGRIYQRLFSSVIEPALGGTTYIPNIRYITASGHEPQNFTKLEIAGEVLRYGKIVEELAALNHPTTATRQESREKFSQIQDFLAFCLDRRQVRIEIPFDRSTIHVDIDGTEHPLQDLGTGIEQLLIIGLASFGFSGKITLVDEPELHFHPTAQKRMVQYLNRNVNDSRFIFATHSASILDAVEAYILQVSYEDGQSVVRTVSNSTERYQAVRGLGHAPSDLLLTRFAIWVEGPSDRVYLNFWLKRIDPDLVEGVDYTILFYGGKILSHHSFLDEDSELVKAVSLARAFAVVMDSDRKPDKPKLNRTKIRVRDEIERQGGLCWITDGREVENYLPVKVIEQLLNHFAGSALPQTKLDQVLDPDKVKKNDFARAAVQLDSDEWPLDLKARVSELVDAIYEAR